MVQVFAIHNFSHDLVKVYMYINSFRRIKDQGFSTTSLFKYYNDGTICYDKQPSYLVSPFHPTDSKRPDSIYNKEVTEPPFYLAVTGGMVLICSFIGTINLIIKLFKLF